MKTFPKHKKNVLVEFWMILYCISPLVKEKKLYVAPVIVKEDSNSFFAISLLSYWFLFLKIKNYVKKVFTSFWLELRKFKHHRKNLFSWIVTVSTTKFLFFITTFSDKFMNINHPILWQSLHKFHPNFNSEKSWVENNFDREIIMWQNVNFTV